MFCGKRVTSIDSPIHELSQFCTNIGKLVVRLIYGDVCEPVGVVSDQVTVQERARKYLVQRGAEVLLDWVHVKTVHLIHDLRYFSFTFIALEILAQRLRKGHQILELVVVFVLQHSQIVFCEQIHVFGQLLLLSSVGLNVPNPILPDCQLFRRCACVWPRVQLGLFSFDYCIQDFLL